MARISGQLGLALLLGFSAAGSFGQAKAGSPPAKAAPAMAARPTALAKPSGHPSGYVPTRFSQHASQYYQAIWGVDALSVKLAESGEVVRFSWRVTDAGRASVLHDKKAAPALEDPQAGVSLVVPSVENIGQLRQAQPPEAGKSYWMVFSNKGRLVKRGDRVNVVVGAFRANGLVVE
ncbi:MAG: hypothetical protein KGL25_08275 [Gammaproteobacteria bacterium]|nr:hypothetical protein [Gammaproteobacteria bacterium]